MKARKRPVVVEVWLFSSSPTMSDMQSAPQWVKNAVYIIEKQSGGVSHLSVRTLEGYMTASPGDWLIHGVNGEVYPCKPDIFEKTYELVNDDTP